MSSMGDERVFLTPILKMSHFQKHMSQTFVLNLAQWDPGWSLDDEANWV